MKENKYDDNSFFNKYARMTRSIEGLKGAGEWHELKKLLPDFNNKTVLDLGAGFGWHSLYAVENGAKRVVAVDISKNMIKIAKEKNYSPVIEYVCEPIEDFKYEKNAFDIVISSLTFHYIKSLDNVIDKVHRTLKTEGNFIFSMEHPIFMAEGSEDWYYDKEGKRLHWPLDNYFYEGKRNTTFLGERVIKYHRTTSTVVNTLIKYGFQIVSLIEPMPEENMLKTIPDMKEELRRPMMLIISSVKK